ncbi:MAG: hypothetical protein M3Q06_11025 [Bacteroidota bacterium]|nr:hypothetical protein [Bacteroidota bacterium]
MYSLCQFKKLSAERQIDELARHGIGLDLAYATKGAEAVLFAYYDFYVELVVEKFTDEILALHCFRSTKRLAPYLRQIDLSEIRPLLFCSR